MNENLTEFTPYSFKYLKYIRLINIDSIPPEEEFKLMKYYKQEILDYKPDVMIFCVVPGNSWLFSRLFEEDK